MRRRLFISVAAAGLVQPAVLRAQGLGTGFPDRPLRLIVAWPVGGSADTIARLFQSRLSEVLRRSIVIENRGGAAGSIGVAEANRAPNDGSAWLFVYDTLATNETAMQLPFRTLEAFVPVCHVASAPLVMVTHPNTPYRSFQDVVDAAASHPWHRDDRRDGGLGRHRTPSSRPVPVNGSTGNIVPSLVLAFPFQVSFDLPLLRQGF